MDLCLVWMMCRLCVYNGVEDDLFEVFFYYVDVVLD